MKDIITGAAGFSGYSLAKELTDRGHEVYAVARPGSTHNSRFRDIDGIVHIIESDFSDYCRLSDMIADKCDTFYHLAWTGDRNDFETQRKNVDYCISALESAAKLGCKRFIGIGSQAEYGVCEDIITEDEMPRPFTTYGAAKTSALYMSCNRASQIGIEWVWGRIFSLYGMYEPVDRMLPNLLIRLKNNEEVNLSSCEQYWDYLNVSDAARAIASLGERGHNGEIYNVANGDFKPLMEFVEIARKTLGSSSIVKYGKKANPFVSLKPDISKIVRDTGWKPQIKFEDGIKSFLESIDK